MMGNVYLFCLVLGFTFTVVGALLGSLVGGHGEGDSSGHGDAGGHDVGAGHDGPEFSHSYEASAGDGPVGHGDGDVAHEAGPMQLPILSPTVLSFFVATFGGSGLLYRQLLGDRLWLHTPLAAATAAAGGFALAYVLWKITRVLDSNRVARTSDVLGTMVEVSVSVPKEGMGEIAYVSAGTRQTLSARSLDGREFKQGSQVKVLKVAEGVAWVGEAPTGGMAAVSAPVAPVVPSIGEPVRDRDRTH